MMRICAGKHQVIRFFLYCMILLLLVPFLVEAKPSRNVCQRFAREIESIVKMGDQVLIDNNPQLIQDQNRRFSDLIVKANRDFVQANACHATAYSASSLWLIKLQERQKPTMTGTKWIQRSQEDYRDNLELCKQGFEVPY